MNAKANPATAASKSFARGSYVLYSQNISTTNNNFLGKPFSRHAILLCRQSELHISYGEFAGKRNTTFAVGAISSEMFLYQFKLAPMPEAVWPYVK